MNHVFISGQVWDCQRKNGFDAVRISVYDGKDKEGNARYFYLNVRVYHSDDGAGISAQKGQSLTVVNGKLSSYKYEDKYYWEVKANARDVFVSGTPKEEKGGDSDDIPF